jgi:dephospho-CoA kinase
LRILGLTGSIGMGKSTAAAALRRMGVAVHDSDLEVHRLLARGGAGVAPVARVFPGVEREGAIDRQALGARVFNDPLALKRLEGIVHPLVSRASRAFLAAASRRRARAVVLDVPLLFESGGETRCDAVIVVSAPSFLQRQRVLRRAGMNAAKFAGILARQMPDAAKRRRADFVVSTGLDKRRALVQLRAILRRVPRRRPRCWRPGHGARGRT